MRFCYAAILPFILFLPAAEALAETVNTRILNRAVNSCRTNRIGIVPIPASIHPTRRRSAYTAQCARQRRKC